MPEAFPRRLAVSALLAAITSAALLGGCVSSAPASSPQIQATGQWDSFNHQQLEVTLHRNIPRTAFQPEYRNAARSEVSINTIVPDILLSYRWLSSHYQGLAGICRHADGTDHQPPARPLHGEPEACYLLQGRDNNSGQLVSSLLHIPL